MISQKKTLKSKITLERPLTVTPFQAVVLRERTLLKYCISLGPFPEDVKKTIEIFHNSLLEKFNKENLPKDLNRD